MSLRFSTSTSKPLTLDTQPFYPSISLVSITGTQGPPGESITGPTGPQGISGESITGPRGESITGPRGENGSRGESITGPRGESIVGPTGPMGESISNWNLNGNEIETGQFIGSSNDKPFVISSNNIGRIIVHGDGSLQLFGIYSPTIKGMIQLSLYIRRLIVPSFSTSLVNVTELAGISLNSLVYLIPKDPLPPGIGIGYVRLVAPEPKLEVSFINCSAADQVIECNFNAFITVV